MAIVETIKDFMGSIVAHNYTELPVKIQDGVNKYLKDDEKIILTLMDYRAVYRAPKFIDSNTFFNSWFILTTHRIIIAKNSSTFKRFRDIALSDITQIFYEFDDTEPRVSITTPGNEDIIEFMRAGAEHCVDLDKKIDLAIENAKTQKIKTASDEHILCRKCGSKVLSQSKYCSECGSRLDAF
ncbi:MAG: PH domain-containing protein [Thermodesulfobacteriota bacterium]